MSSIALYLGAHKTATTHLQGILGQGREWLAERDVGLSLPHDLRKTWLPEFFRWAADPDRDQQTTLREKLRALRPGARRWILSEENIVGVSNDLMTRNGLYPMAGERVGVLASLFDDSDAELFFSVRSYADFYRSAYSEVVRNRGFIPFGRFYDDARFRGNSWVDMLRGICAWLPAEKITVWCYEDFEALLPRLLQLITGLESVGPLLALGGREPTRPSLSSKTLEVLSLLEPVLERKESLALVERINRAYPVSPENRVFDPFTPEQKQSMADRYRKDIASIRAGFPGIRFLVPEA